jgi:predicted RNA-binding Zn-ribbon protein involved in translation (DUF1610 family)
MGEADPGSVPAATYTLACGGCQLSIAVGGDATAFDCGSCGARSFVFRCDRCGGAGLIAGAGRAVPAYATCSWCLHQVRTGGLNRLRRGDGATVADAWRSHDDHGLTYGDPEVRVLGGFEMVAGSGDCPPVGTLCSIAGLADGVLVVAEVGARGRTLLPYRELLELDVGGHGQITSGRRFAGGGVGITGALAGIAVASMLNNATRKTEVDSFIRLTSPGSEMVLRHWRCTPETVRGTLSRIFVGQLAAARAAAASPTIVMPAPLPEPQPAGPVDELERLTKLHAAGTLTDSEFEAARARQIKRLQAGEVS